MLGYGEREERREKRKERREWIEDSRMHGRRVKVKRPKRVGCRERCLSEGMFPLAKLCRAIPLLAMCALMGRKNTTSNKLQQISPQSVLCASFLPTFSNRCPRSLHCAVT